MNRDVKTIAYALGGAILVAIIAAFFRRNREMVSDIPVVGDVSEFIFGSMPNINFGDIYVPGFSLGDRNPANFEINVPPPVFVGTGTTGGGYVSPERRDTGGGCGCGCSNRTFLSGVSDWISNAASGLEFDFPYSPPYDPIEAYLANNPGVRQAWQSNSHSVKTRFSSERDFAVWHYENHGRREGRTPSPYGVN